MRNPPGVNPQVEEAVEVGGEGPRPQIVSPLIYSGSHLIHSQLPCCTPVFHAFDLCSGGAFARDLSSVTGYPVDLSFPLSPSPSGALPFSSRCLKGIQTTEWNSALLV